MELWESLNRKNKNCRVLKKILEDKDREIDELKLKFDSGESEAVLRSENEDLFKELERIKGEHQQQIKAMEESSELAITKQQEEIEALKAELEKSKKLAEDHAAATEASRAKLAEFEKERKDFYSEILGKF